MDRLPSSIVITEVGPQEAFQSERTNIPTVDKVELVDALSSCGFARIQPVSFVADGYIPWADAEAVAAGFTANPEVTYAALWLSTDGLERALPFGDKLTLEGGIAFSASEPFSVRMLNRTREAQIEAMCGYVAAHQACGVPVTHILVMAAFGCDYGGDVDSSAVRLAVTDGLGIADAFGLSIGKVTIADSMGWGSPQAVARTVGSLRDIWPELEIVLHLHNNRGLGIACAYEGLRLGVRHFEASVGGLGGCPLTSCATTAGNIATEELVLMCEDMGIETGIDIEALFEAGRLAERIIGRPLSSAALRSGTSNRPRKRAA